MIVRPYTASDRKRWDTFVRNSRNGTFLFERDYMEYHADRFTDASLIVEDQGAVLALLPASRHDDVVRSHGGLTYGGFITDGRMRVEKMLAVFDASLAYFLAQGVRQLDYKPVPHIYHRSPAEEDCYALFRQDARLIRREPSAALALGQSTIPGKKRNGAARAQAFGLYCTVVQEAAELITLIDANLLQRHAVHAVHAADEMQRLHAVFPHEIELIEVRDRNATLVAGAIVYVAGPVAHTQYLVVSDAGRPLRAMDLLISELVERYHARCHWLEFGTSTEQGGRELNAGLMSQKEEFGAHCVCYDTYQLSTERSPCP